MASKNGPIILYWMLTLLWLLRLRPASAATVLLDDNNSALQYSSGDPVWYAGDEQTSGKYTSWQNNVGTTYQRSFHEALGDGASVSLSFIGTKVNLTGTICTAKYNTTIDAYIDDTYYGRYSNIVSSNPSSSLGLGDYVFWVSFFVIDGLSPALHTFKAVSVGSDSLFVVDSASYESASSSNLSGSSASLRLSSSGASVSASRSVSASSSSRTTNSSATATAAAANSTAVFDPLLPLTSAMDIPPSDSSILYLPKKAWSRYNSTVIVNATSVNGTNTNSTHINSTSTLQKRGPVCLDGVMITSTFGATMEYNFTGTAVDVYTMSSQVGGNYSVTIDGKNVGVVNSYSPSADNTTCNSRNLYSIKNLDWKQHKLVLTVLQHPRASTHDTIQFIGLRLPGSPVAPTPSSSASASGTNTSPAQLNIVPIVGGVVGGLAGLLIMTLLMIWWLNRRRRKEEMAGTEQLNDPPFRSPSLQPTDDPFANPQQPNWANGGSFLSIPPFPPGHFQQAEGVTAASSVSGAGPDPIHPQETEQKAKGEPDHGSSTAAVDPQRSGEGIKSQVA